MFSQNNEEYFITERFKGMTGRFMDIGAYDGKTFSNTMRLVELGWGGVCVEASPIVFPKLLETHKAHNGSTIELVQVAISADKTPKMVQWWDSGGDAVSTTNIAHKDKWIAGYGSKFSSFYVWTMPVEALFTAFGYGFEFVNLDVESTNHEIFLEIPWAKLVNVKLICVEHDGHYHHMMEVMKPLGFAKLALNGENLLLTR
jgi:FkbM family methyltransferase